MTCAQCNGTGKVGGGSTGTLTATCDGCGGYGTFERARDWLIFEARDRLWWKPNGNGYTAKLSEAGRYTEDEARRAEAAAAKTSERKDYAVPLAAVLAGGTGMIDGGALASAMRKVLPTQLLDEVIAHCDPLRAFVKARRD